MKVVTDISHYEAIAQAIQDNHNMSFTYTPSEMAGGVYSVAEYKYSSGYNDGLEAGVVQGRQAEYDEFWDDMQSNGAVKSYMRCFQGNLWTDNTFNPKYNIVTTNLQATFYNNSKITRIPVLVDISGVTNSTYTSQSFYACSSLQKLSLKIAETTPWNSNTFNGLTALKEIAIEGTIGQQNFDLRWSVRLSKDSLLSILNACNGTTHTDTITITLPPRCIDNDTRTETYITNDTELSTALANARNKNYSIVYG